MLAMKKEWENLINEIKKGSVYALAQLITKVENRDQGWLEAMQIVYPNTGKARVIGITGSPGAGKSSLTDKLTPKFLEKGLSVGIIAIDPTSPFSGGALLGDRVRMKGVINTEGVFVRSMATRGALGGLSLAARDVVKIMDAFGKDIILIETVGVGQDEVEVVKTADLTIVVCVPGMGDGIQAIKAGIMEIADIFVVNKSDQEGADQLVSNIQSMLDMASGKYSRKIPIVKTIATTGEGVEELVTQLFQELESHQNQIAWQEARVREEILSLLEKEVSRHIRVKWDQSGNIDSAVKQVLGRQRDPYSIIQEIVSSVFH